MIDIQLARVYLWCDCGYHEDYIHEILKKQKFSEKDEETFRMIYYRILKNDFKNHKNPLEMNWSPVFREIKKRIPYVLTGLEDDE